MICIATPKPTPNFLFAYSGRELDGDLQFNQFRHYDPTVGRFLSEVPAAYAGDANLHRNAGNGSKQHCTTSNIVPIQCPSEL